MLTQAVVANAGLLRQVADWSGDAAPTVSDLARALDRDLENTRKSIKGLEGEGVLARADAGWGLSERGRAVVAALDLAEGGAAPAGGGAPADYRALLHAQIAPDPLNPRTDWDSPAAVEALDELAADILANGLLQNLVVKPAGVDANAAGANAVRVGTPTESRRYAVVGGERRWRAIGRLIEAGDWPADRPIACKVVEVDELGHRLKALAENLKRRNLNYIEEAQAYAGLVEAGVKTAELAGAVNVTQRMIQQRLQLLELDPKDQARVAVGEMTLEQARNKLANRPHRLDLKPEQRLVLVEVLHAARFAVAKGYGQKVPVRTWVREDPVFKQLEYSLLNGPHYDDEARAYVATGYHLNEQVELQFPGFSQDRDAALAAVWREVLGEGCAVAAGATYHTPWLNGPFAPDAAELAAREDTVRRRAEADALHQAARQRAQTALDNARQVALDLKQPRREALDERFAPVAAEGGAPLPWRQDDYGRVVDANGKRVGLDGWNPGPVMAARIALIVAAMNNAAGLETPDAPAEPADDADAEDFADDADAEEAAA